MDKIKLTYDKYLGLISRLCNKLKKVKFDAVIGISRGGVLPALIISHKFDVPMGVIAAQRYTKDNKGGNFVCSKNIVLLSNKRLHTVLLVDDICDEGITMQMIKSKLCDKYAKIITATIFARSTKNIPQFVVKHVDDEWIVFPYEVC